MALTEFTLFPKLPAELRDQIWKFALPGPRTITISVRRCSENQAEGERRGFTFNSSDFRTEANSQGLLPTTLLHACHESREIVLGRYELAFLEPLQDNGTWIDWDRDCLYFEETRSFRLCCGGWNQSILVQPLPHHVICWQKKLRHLAIGGDNFDEWETNRMEYLGTLKTLVLEDPEDDYYLTREEKEDWKGETIALLENIWRPHMSSNSSLPKITFVTDEELERRSEVEKVRRLPMTLL